MSRTAPGARQHPMLAGEAMGEGRDGAAVAEQSSAALPGTRCAAVVIAGTGSPPLCAEQRCCGRLLLAGGRCSALDKNLLRDNLPHLPHFGLDGCFFFFSFFPPLFLIFQHT